MKLLFVSNLFPDARDPVRGLDNAVLLQHLARRGSVRVLAPRPVVNPFSAWFPPRWVCREVDATLKAQYVPVPYIPVFGSRWNHRLMRASLRRHFRELHQDFAFDRLLSSWLYPDSCSLVPLAQEWGIPQVAIAQGTDVHQYLEMPVRRRIIVDHLRSIRGVITRSRDLARRLVEAGMDEQRVHPVYNGVDTSVFRPGNRDAIRTELGLAAGCPVVLYVGNFRWIKNPLFLVEAHAELVRGRAGPKAILVMVGAGPLEEPIRREVQRAGTSPLVLMPGRLPPEQIARYMQAADVLCVPSRNEGVPNVVLEAFACGLPVVATRVGGLSEVVIDAGLGCLIEPGRVPALVSGLTRVLDHPPKQEAISQHGRMFSWDRAVEAYLKVLGA